MATPTQPMTPDEIAALRQKAAAATPGPWVSRHEFMDGDVWYVGPGDPLLDFGVCGIASKYESPEVARDEANAAFIAAFNPAVALALLDDLDTTRALANRVHTDAKESAAANVADEQEDEKELEELRAKVTRLEQENARLKLRRHLHDEFYCPLEDAALARSETAEDRAEAAEARAAQAEQTVAKVRALITTDAWRCEMDESDSFMVVEVSALQRALATPPPEGT